MKIKQKRCTLAVHLALSVIAGVSSNLAYAQTANSEEKVQRIEITGSHIKRIQSETADPMTVISKEEIIRSGATSVLDIMRSLTSAGGNGGEMAGSNSFRNGATEVSLRGLPTLVLLNGYRLPLSGSDEYSGQTSVDLNAIPTSAIERIEILKDGASAVYGTDAVGGVVNFILRKDFTGLTLNAGYGRTTYNDGAVSNVSGAYGFGDRAKDGFNVTASLSYEKAEVIRAVDRPFSKSLDKTNRENGLHSGNVFGNYGNDPGTLSLGGAQRMPDPACRAENRAAYPNLPEWFASPERNACMYLRPETTDLARPYTRYGGALTANWDIAQNTSLFFNGFYNHFDTTLNSSPLYIQNATRTGALRVEADHPNNTYNTPVVIRRLFPAQRGGTDTTTKTSWFVTGVNGQTAGWDWTASLGHAEEKGHVQMYGAYMFDKLQNYVATGKFNPFGGNNNSAQIINELSANVYVDTKSSTDFLKFVGSTEFGSLPGGKIGFAAGAEYKKQSLRYDPSQNYQNGEIGNYTILRSINGSESLSALFTEVNLPILKNLEANAALRYDKYENSGNTTNPKIGLRWTATPTFMLRSTYSTGFRAPTLSQQYSGGRGGFSTARDPRRCVAGNVYFDNDCSSSVLSLLSGTKGIQPEKSSNANIGFVFEPVKDLNLAMTYWRITWKNRIENLDKETVLAGESGSYANAIERNAVTAEDLAAYNALTADQRAKLGPLVGKLKQVKIGLINRSKVFTDGLDLDGSYTMRTASGKYKVYTEISYTKSYEKALLPDDPDVNCPNNTACEAGEHSYPRVLAKLGLDWDHGPWNATAVANFVSSYKVTRSPTEVINDYYGQYANGVMVGSSTLFNVSAGYKGYKDLTLRFGINNLFNREPPFDSGATNGYDTNYGQPRGRHVYVNASYNFK